MRLNLVRHTLQARKLSKNKEPESAEKHCIFEKRSPFPPTSQSLLPSATAYFTALHCNVEKFLMPLRLTVLQ